MKWKSFGKCCHAIKILIGLTLVFSSSSYGASFVLEKADSPNEGLYDKTAVSPIGGNTGRTLGAQRRKVFNAVFAVLAKTIESDVPIQVRVTFDPLSCNKNSGVVGGAAPMGVFWDFTGAPEPDVLYPTALANQHAGLDLDPGYADIEVIINSSIDNNNSCLNQTNFYYGLDGAEPRGTINLFSIVLHEVIHGLGFLSLTDIDGSFLFDLKDPFSQYIYDEQYDMYWPEMTNAQRADSFDNSYDVTWRGPEIIFRGEGVDGTASERYWNGQYLRYPYLYAPLPIEPGSSISHWNDLTPDQLMEPYVSSKPIVKVSQYERAALLDLGWPLTNPLPIIDTDGDGVRDRDDHFPSNSSESADTDGDGLGDNEDTDDDNDKMPDNWESAVGTDPFTNDAESDPDTDGFTNFEEMLARTNPLDIDELPEALAGYFTDFSAPELPQGWYKISTLQEPNHWFLENEALKAPVKKHHTINFGGLLKAGDKILVDAILDNAGGDDDCSPSIRIGVQRFNGNLTYIPEFEDYPRGSVTFGQPKMFVYEIEENRAGVASLKFSSQTRFARSWCSDDAYVQMDNFAIIGPNTDIDGDGIPGFEELENGLDPRFSGDALQDNDADGLNNVEEFLNSTDLHNPDSDADGLSDGIEVKDHLTNPLSKDTDNDGLDDKWEIENGLLPNDENDATADLDGDGYTNYEEYITDSDPTDSNSTPNQISAFTEDFEDGSYLSTWKPTPNQTSFISVNEDSFSGVKSIQSTSNEPSEVTISAEFDEGLLSFMLDISSKKFALLIDGELALKLDRSTHGNWESVSYLVPAGVHRLTFANIDPLYIPCVSIMLSCALANQDNQPGMLRIDTARFVSSVDDADTDGMSDTFENNNGLDSGINDSSLDLDGDGFSNLEEFLANTYPNNPISFPSTIPLDEDSDSDGLTDNDEVNLHGTNPENRDSDNDLIPDNWEIQYGLNPLAPNDAKQDEDNDEYSNLREFGGKTNPLISTSIPQSSPWQTFQGNAQHTGYVPISINTAEASEQWTKTVFDSSSLHPIVTFDGKVFVSSDSYYGAQKLSALSLNGTELWQHDFGTIQRVSGPAISEGKIFIQTAEPNNFLYGFEPHSGNIQIQNAYSSQTYQSIAPTTFGSNVYIQGGDYPSYNRAYSFNTTTGEQNWFNSLLPNANWAPAVNDSHVFICSGAELMALNRQTGLKEYEISTSACKSTQPAKTNSPVIGANSNALIVGLGDLVSFDLTEQSINWIRRRGGYTGIPAVGIGLVAAITNGSLAVHNEKDGSILWTWSPASGSLQDNLVLTNSHIFTSTNDVTYAINLKTHQNEWSYNKGGHLVVSEELLYISSSDGTLSVITLVDTDSDGMANGWELEYGLDPENPADAQGDLDGDNLTNLQEYQEGSNPTLVDSDGDSLSDYDEVTVHTTSPIKQDTDNDGMTDNWELDNGFDPLSPPDAAMDTDGDGLINLEEYRHGSNPHKTDTDDDGMDDKWEADYGLDSQDPTDTTEDLDTDGLTNIEEFQRGTNPTLEDSDSDNLTDYDEVTSYGTNPTLVDSDDDNLTDYNEIANHGTNPTSSDSDGDGIDDGFEITNGLNPLIKDSSDDADADGFSNLEEFITGNNPLDANDKPADPDLTFGDQLCSFNTDAITASIHPQSDKAYIPDQASNTIDIITVTRVGCVSKSVPVAGEPQDVAFSEDGSKYFVTIGSAQELHVYDSETDQLINAIPLPAIGYEVVAGGDIIYVSGLNAHPGIMRINAETEIYIDSFGSVNFDYTKIALELSPNAKRLFFANRNTSNVVPGVLAVYDVSVEPPLLLDTTYPAAVLGPDGRSLAVDPINGNFVSYATAGQFSYGPETNGKIHKLPSEDFFAPLGHFPTGASAKVIEYSHNGLHAYTVNTSDEIKVWNSNEFTLEETLTISGEARDVVESWSQRYLVVATDTSVQILHLNENSSSEYKPNSWWRFKLMEP